MDRILVFVQEIRKQQRKSLRFEEQWKSLTVELHPISGIGLFALGAGVSMVITGIQSSPFLAQLLQLIGGSIVVLFAMNLFMTPVYIQRYLLQNPSQIKSYFNVFNDETGLGTVAALRKWAKQQGEAGKGIMVSVSQAVFFARIGMLGGIVLLLAIFTFAYGFLTLLLWRQFGFGYGSVILVVLSALLGALTLIIARGRKHTRTRA